LAFHEKAEAALSFMFASQAVRNAAFHVDVQRGDGTKRHPMASCWKEWVMMCSGEGLQGRACED